MIMYLSLVFVTMSAENTIVLCMSSAGHPEDQIIGRTLIYTGQEKSKRYDSMIPSAQVLLYRVNKIDTYHAFRIEFHRQIRVRNEPDPRNPGVVTYRPLFEFTVVERLPEVILPAEFYTHLENKVLSLLRYGLLCKYDSVHRGILPCERFEMPPNLYDRRMLNWWKKSKLIEEIEKHGTRKNDSSVQ